MSATPPKFLLKGVNFTYNFFGRRTVQTGIYGTGELIIKYVPLFLVIYGASKLNIYQH